MYNIYKLNNHLKLSSNSYNTKLRGKGGRQAAAPVVLAWLVALSKLERPGAWHSYSSFLGSKHSSSKTKFKPKDNKQGSNSNSSKLKKSSVRREVAIHEFRGLQWFGSRHTSPHPGGRLGSGCWRKPGSHTRTDSGERSLGGGEGQGPSLLPTCSSTHRHFFP